jgi:hypothetical protein
VVVPGKFGIVNVIVIAAIVALDATYVRPAGAGTKVLPNIAAFPMVENALKDIIIIIML